MPAPLEIDVASAAQLVRQGSALLLDVREPDELARVHIAGSKHLPMREIPARLAEIPADRHVLVLCHHGGRSGRVTQFLRANGLDNITNITGGIDAWARQVDPSLARY
ncbi:MAG: sulfurtransferase [Opitutus sp.]|nr:sulfurtransferase [Opitutus sp.]